MSRTLLSKLLTLPKYVPLRGKDLNFYLYDVPFLILTGDTLITPEVDYRSFLYSWSLDIDVHVLKTVIRLTLTFRSLSFRRDDCGTKGRTNLSLGSVPYGVENRILLNVYYLPTTKSVSQTPTNDT